MRYKLVDEKPKTFVLVFETKDELAQGRKDFTRTEARFSELQSHWRTFVREARWLNLERNNMNRRFLWMSK